VDPPHKLYKSNPVANYDVCSMLRIHLRHTLSSSSSCDDEKSMCS